MLPVLLLELKGVRLGTGDLSSIEVMAPFLAADSVTQVIALMAAIGILMSRCGATWQDLGFDGSQWPADCRLGFFAFWLIVPPVLALEWPDRLLGLNAPTAGQNAARGSSTDLDGHRRLAAVIVAPLVEEFFVRVVLQGWLEAVVARRVGEAPSAAPGIVERWATAMPGSWAPAGAAQRGRFLADAFGPRARPDSFVLPGPGLGLSLPPDAPHFAVANGSHFAQRHVDGRAVLHALVYDQIAAAASVYLWAAACSSWTVSVSACGSTVTGTVQATLPVKHFPSSPSLQ